MEIRNEIKNEKASDKPKFVSRSLADVQRAKLEKLMKNPDKPIIIPERPQEKDFSPNVKSFVRNVMGSSAGAGSGEFHVYRHLRRKEYARQKNIQMKTEKEMMDDEYRQKLETNRLLAQEKTAKKRAKRQKKKNKGKNKKPKMEEPESESEESENSEHSETEEAKEASEKDTKTEEDSIEDNESREIGDKANLNTDDENIKAKNEESENVGSEEPEIKNESDNVKLEEQVEIKEIEKKSDNSRKEDQEASTETLEQELESK